MKNIKYFTLTLFMLSSIFSTVFAQDLILSAPPRETAAAGAEIYGPIATYLTQLLGITVTYKHPGNWLKYQREMRKNKYDIVFDGPHFISWREQHLGHEPIVRLPGILQFFLIADKNKAQYKHPDKLIGKNICGISPPNLSILSILDYYRNPVRQPVIRGIKGGMGKVFKAFSAKDSKCAAAVLRTRFYQKKLKDNQRALINIIYKTQQMPNQGISVGKRISPEHKLLIKKSLTVGDGVVSTQALLKRFGAKAKHFIPVEAKEYLGYNYLLEGVIFGW